MKYKKVELELPPLGQLILVKMENGDCQIGFFYTLEGEKEFKPICSIEGSVNYCDLKEIKEWKHIPSLHSLKDKPLPIGQCVIVKYKGEDEGDCPSFNPYIGLLECKNTHYGSNKIIGWIEVDELKK